MVKYLSSLSARAVGAENVVNIKEKTASRAAKITALLRVLDSVKIYYLIFIKEEGPSEKKRTMICTSATEIPK